MLRRLVLASLATTAVGTAGLGPLPPLPLLSQPDALTVSVSKSGHMDGTYELTCDDRPGGTHPRATDACTRLDGFAKSGEDPFAPVSEDALCTQMYGGEAVAHVTGTWLGREIDARFSRANGCEINRWENLKPVLPGVPG
ncbi:SSI family serine proteinase inhibitor [Streptomyces sp. NPDC003327]